MIRADMKFDTRTVEHRLRRGEISMDQFESHLAELPDDAAELEETEVQFTASWAERHQDASKDATKG